MLYTLLGVLRILLDVASWIIFAQIILSLLIAFNVINTYNDGVRQVYAGLTRMTEPLYRPIRRIMPDFGPLDFSPMVVLLGIRILDYIFAQMQASAAIGGGF